MALSFDTLQYVKKLREAGVTEAAAEIQAEALMEVIENNLATKQDIKELRQDTASLKKDLTRDITLTKMELTRDIELSKKDLTIRFGSMLTVAVSLISVLITLLNRFH
jgi:hypothetical protein